MELKEPSETAIGRSVLTLRAKFVGALLGGMVGDGFGAPLQAWSPERVQEALYLMSRLPPDSAYRTLYEGVLGPLCGRLLSSRYHYTDETQMSIAVTESLVSCGRFDGPDMARRLVENFDAGRGYGPGIYTVLQQLKRGVPWNAVGQQVFGGQGSSCNGGAARIAPLALLYHESNAPDLRRIVELTTSISHAHPIGMEGAVIQAFAIVLALLGDPTREISPSEFLTRLQILVASRLPEAQAMLRRVQEVLTHEVTPDLLNKAFPNAGDALQSVGVALTAFLTHPFSYRDAVLLAIRMGGDTDTHAALTGTLSGAFLGHGGIPNDWIIAIENERKGRDYYARLALELYSVWQEPGKRQVPVK